MRIFQLVLLFSIPVQTTKFDDYHRALLEHFLNFSNIYFTKYVVTLRRDANDLYKTRRGIDIIKWLSRNSIYSSVVKMDQLVMDLKYYHDKINDPLLFIVIQSRRDFRLYANLTRSLKPTAKTFRVIMIFEKAGRICHDPPGNSLNLVFDSKLLVKCPDSEIIREWYSVYPNKTETNELVRWYRNGEHRGNEYLTDTLFRDRRQDLGGLNIRVTVQKEHADKDGKIRGMCYDLITEIARRINFTIDWQPLESKVGTYNPKTNTTDGILGKLASNKTDIGLGLFGLTADRLKRFDFSMPLVETRISYFIRRSNNNVYNFMSYSALTPEAAISCHAIMFISTIILTMITLTDEVRFSKSIVRIYMDHCFDTTAIIVNGNVQHNPVRIPARIVHLILLLLYILFFATFTAQLTSYRAVYKAPLPSLDDIANAKSHKLLTMNSGIYAEKLFASESKATRKLRKHLVTDSSMRRLYKKMCADDSSYLLYMDESTLNMKHFLPPRNCKLVPINRGRMINAALVFQKNSPYLNAINFQLQKFYLIGLLSAVKKKWILIGRPDEEVDNFQPATMETVIQPHLILIFAILLSFTILMCEKAHHRFFAR